MRLLAFDFEPSSKRGGQELSLVDELVGLAGVGHEVTLAYQVPGDLLAQYTSAGVRTVQTSSWTIHHGSAGRSLLGCGRTLAVTLPMRFGAVVVNQYHGALLPGILARLRNVPLVCHLRIFPPEAFSRQWTYGLWGVSRFIAVSRAVRDAWVALGCDPDAVDVVHDGVDTEWFRPRDNRDAVRRALGVPADAFTVLYAGRLDRSKNIESLLRAFAGLGLPPSGARLLVAGRPVDTATPEAGAAYVAELRRLAAQLGIADAVHWIGPRGDVPDLLSAADASALFAYNEAFGRATVESLACGVPVVVTRYGGSAEIMTGEFQRLTFDLDDPAGATNLFRSLIGWQRRDPDFARRARQHAVSMFGKEAMIHGAEASLERAVAAGPRRSGPPPASVRAARAARRLVAPVPAAARRDDGEPRAALTQTSGEA